MSGSRWSTTLLLLAVLLAMLPRPALAEQPAAAGQPPVTLRVDLITVGPGDALLTRAGHVALLVTEVLPDGRELTRGYNYGVTDFSDPWIPLRFAFGELRFWAEPTGDLYATAEYYGLLQDRDVWRQPLALTQAQAQRLAARLEHDSTPEHREYRYHYLEATCSTKVRDLLDEITGDALRRQLDGQRDPWTVRDFQQLTFDGTPLTALASDLVFGRMHDLPVSRHYTLLWPERMRTTLTEVRVPDPAGTGDLVPLAGPPEVLAERGAAPAIERRNRVTWIAGPLVLVWALAGAAWVLRHGPARPRLCAVWLWAWALPSGVFGLAIAALAVGSPLPQLRDNELLASLLPTDLVLVWLGVRWWRRGPYCPGWLPGYAVARLLVVVAAVGGRAVGVAIQEPWVVPLASLGCSVALGWVALGLRRRASARASEPG
jgi:hypothetical protein